MNFSWMFVILTGSWSVATDQICKDLAQPKTFFEFVDPRTTLGNFKLGEGQFGNVYLKQDSELKFYVQKVYKGDQFGSTSQFQNDLRAFRYLSKYASRFSFEVPVVEAKEKGEMRLAYHPGRTVLDILSDPKTNLKIREQVKNSYNKMTFSLMEFLKSEEFDVEKLKQSELIRFSAYNDSFTMGSIYIIIKPDNVIVSPFTLKLTLIDAS